MEIRLSERRTPPEWALWERRLLDTMGALAREFTRRYTRPDGTLVWREQWLGMDGSDDAYESFFNFPLFAALGGDMELDTLARAEWEAITRQFTAYGQVYREYDAYYDWMHHGESSLLLYYFGLTQPKDLRFRSRSVRFAQMYNGEDAEAPNYDPERRLMRSPITGSKGPRFENSAEDWSTHREVLANYPPPFPDIPGVPQNERADWNDDAIFEEILRLLNARQMRGDVPLNLTATSLMANAFLYTGDVKYRDWITGYLQAWLERAEANGGVLPDNVGENGVVGENMDGKWYGGYYGWRWPHGFMSLIEPAVIAASNALLLTGDTSHLELPRQLLDAVFERGRWIDGAYCIPHRHAEEGWRDYRPLFSGVHADVPAAADYPVHLWNLSQSEEDLARVERWRGGANWNSLKAGRGKGDNIHTANWYAYLRGENPNYPVEILRVNYEEASRRCERMNDDDTDPETWDVHHWQDLNPTVCEGLVQLMLGAPQTIYHGGLLHCRLRYFDPVRRRTGVPPDVAALVSVVDAEGVIVEFVNLHLLEERVVVAQAGAFGEHRFDTATYTEGGETRSIPINDRCVQIRLAPGSGGVLRLNMSRYSHTPRYGSPWDV